MCISSYGTHNISDQIYFFQVHLYNYEADVLNALTSRFAQSLYTAITIVFWLISIYSYLATIRLIAQYETYR